VIRGLVGGTSTERVNLINAAQIAKARGITVVERKTPDAGAFATLVTVSGEVGGRLRRVAGTLANAEQRIVRIDAYDVDMAPATWMLLTQHNDRPGMIGRVGHLLGEADINISAMHLARSAPRSEAFMFLALDDPVPAPVAAAIRGIDGVTDNWVMDLGGGE
jgi:D-3-phosphoglycerate dehydrogenase